MNTRLITNAPLCSCHLMHVQNSHWHVQLRTWITERNTISFDLADLDRVLELEAELTARRYEHQILHSDCHRHFLVPLHK